MTYQEKEDLSRDTALESVENDESVRLAVESRDAFDDTELMDAGITAVASEDAWLETEFTDAGITAAARDDA